MNIETLQSRRRTCHTAQIVYDYRRVLSNRGQSLGCVGAIILLV